MPTSSAACARASARPRCCASRPACATPTKTSRSRSACCSGTRPTPGSLWRRPRHRTARRCSSAPPRPASASPSSAPGRRACRARTGWPCSATTSSSTKAKPKPGGLNEYGLASVQDGRRLRAEGDRLAALDRRHRGALRAGGRRARSRWRLSATATTPSSSASASAASTRWASPSERTRGVDDAVAFIAGLRQAGDPAACCRSAAASSSSAAA